jgi:hypothetical protein
MDIGEFSKTFDTKRARDKNHALSDHILKPENCFNPLVIKRVNPNTPDEVISLEEITDLNKTWFNFLAGGRRYNSIIRALKKHRHYYRNRGRTCAMYWIILEIPLPFSPFPPLKPQDVNDALKKTFDTSIDFFPKNVPFRFRVILQRSFLGTGLVCSH